MITHLASGVGHEPQHEMLTRADEQRLPGQCGNRPEPVGTQRGLADACGLHSGAAARRRPRHRPSCGCQLPKP